MKYPYKRFSSKYVYKGIFNGNEIMLKKGHVTFYGFAKKYIIYIKAEKELLEYIN